MFYVKLMLYWLKNNYDSDESVWNEPLSENLQLWRLMLFVSVRL